TLAERCSRHQVSGAAGVGPLPAPEGLSVAREEEVAGTTCVRGPLRRRYCQRACTFTRGNSGGLPSRSTTRRMPSVDSIKRFWFEKLRILPHDLGSATSYLAVAVCASAR